MYTADGRRSVYNATTPGNSRIPVPCVHTHARQYARSAWLVAYCLLDNITHATGGWDGGGRGRRRGRVRVWAREREIRLRRPPHTHTPFIEGRVETRLRLFDFLNGVCIYVLCVLFFFFFCRPLPGALGRICARVRVWTAAAFERRKRKRTPASAGKMVNENKPPKKKKTI